MSEFGRPVPLVVGVMVQAQGSGGNGGITRVPRNNQTRRALKTEQTRQIMNYMIVINATQTA